MCNDFFKFSLNFSNTSIILFNVILSETLPKFLISSTNCENVCTTGVKYCLTLFQIFLTQLTVSFNVLLTIGRLYIFFAILLIQLPRSESQGIKFSITVRKTPFSLIWSRQATSQSPKEAVSSSILAVAFFMPIFSNIFCKVSTPNLAMSLIKVSPRSITANKPLKVRVKRSNVSSDTTKLLDSSCHQLIAL